MILAHPSKVVFEDYKTLGFAGAPDSLLYR
jgi:hypothetical protein